MVYAKNVKFFTYDLSFTSDNKIFSSKDFIPVKVKINSVLNFELSSYNLEDSTA